MRTVVISEIHRKAQAARVGNPDSSGDRRIKRALTLSSQHVRAQSRVELGTGIQSRTLRRPSFSSEQIPSPYFTGLFDDEEALQSWSAADGLYGSRHFVQALAQDQVKQIRVMINVDMIGGRHLHIHRDTHSDPQLSKIIFRECQELGYGRYFVEMPLSVEDDYQPIVRAGIPAVELISLDYGPLNLYWHTPLDTVGKCSATCLGIVGWVLPTALDDLERGLMFRGFPMAVPTIRIVKSRAHPGPLIKVGAFIVVRVTAKLTICVPEVNRSGAGSQEHALFHRRRAFPPYETEQNDS